MFNLQGSEIVIILLLALVVLGPEKLPDAMRKAGQLYGELKKMSSGFQSEFRAAVEEPLRELKETANTIRDSADFTKLQSGGRAEKPKSAEMLAAPDPDLVPTEDIPFQGASVESSEPVAPADQEPFASVIVSGGAAAAAQVADADPEAPAEAADEPPATEPPATEPPATEPPATEPPKPAAFSGDQVSSAAPPRVDPSPEPPTPFSNSQISSAAAPLVDAAAPDDAHRHPSVDPFDAARSGDPADDDGSDDGVDEAGLQ